MLMTACFNIILYLLYYSNFNFQSPHKVAQNFYTEGKIMKCGNSHESYWIVLYCGNVDFTADGEGDHGIEF